MSERKMREDELGRDPKGSGCSASPSPDGLGPSGEHPSRNMLVNENGRVAVLYAPGFGAGWYTWASKDDEMMVFDRDLALAVQAGDYALALEIAERKWPDEYSGGVKDLRIVWMEPGTAFRIDEYDGNESIRYAGDDIIVVPRVAPAIETEGEDAKRLSAKHESAVGKAEAPINPVLLSALKAMDEALTKAFPYGLAPTDERMLGPAWIQIRSAISQADGR